MKRYILTAFAFASIIGAMQAQVKMPAPSPTQSIKQDFGTASIELTYSRPSVKGRKILGQQDPWGKVWRTGANAATRIRFNEPVEIGGKKIDSGTYVIYTVPRKNEPWDVIINKGINNWGTDGYKESDDICRFTASPVKKRKQHTETFTMLFANIKPESCELSIMWDNWTLSFPITVNIKDKIRAQVETALKTDNKPYWNAANFYYEWDKDYPKALENVNKAIEENKTGFWMYLLKAKILRAMGNKSEATIAAQKCVELATTAKNDAYIKQGGNLIKELK
jgi:hypothetical protein